jgi:hypothetical protein
VVHVPSALAPSAAEHTSHDALHAVLQHTPSEQWRLAHEWSPVASSESPAQARPIAFCGMQLPALLLVQ